MPKPRKLDPRHSRNVRGLVSKADREPGPGQETAGRTGGLGGLGLKEGGSLEVKCSRVIFHTTETMEVYGSKVGFDPTSELPSPKTTVAGPKHSQATRFTHDSSLQR